MNEELSRELFFKMTREQQEALVKYLSLLQELQKAQEAQESEDETGQK